MDERPIWEQELDARVRSTLVIDPPVDVQRSILAAVLQATAAPALSSAMAAPEITRRADRPVPLFAYALLAAVLVVYVAAVSWLHGVVGGTGWLSTMLTQVVTVSEVVFGRPAVTEPLSVAWLLLQRAPWVALLPLAWLLWERDRAAAPAA